MPRAAPVTIATLLSSCMLRSGSSAGGYQLIKRPAIQTRLASAPSPPAEQPVEEPAVETAVDGRRPDHLTVSLSASLAACLHASLASDRRGRRRIAPGW